MFLLFQFNAYVLDQGVLLGNILYRDDTFGLTAAEEGDIGAINRSYRHAAYRQYILYVFSRLKVGDRRVIPSCVIRRIREGFPAPNGFYTGYIPGRLS